MVANSLNPYEAQQNVGPDLDPFLEKISLVKYKTPQQTKSPNMQRVMGKLPLLSSIFSVNVGYSATVHSKKWD